MKTVEIFSDGACRGNPGPGDWGVLLRYNGAEKNLYGAEAPTTNKRMELLAAIRGLEAVSEACQIGLTSDSHYVRKGITEWLQSWKTAAKKPVKNKNLGQLLDEQAQRHQVNWRWVKGHSGHRENEIADELANLGIDDLLEQA
ncbi:MAG: ribonuclease HI [Gammaproteobacteria bacterium]|nr:ribonuclease HI [Gammaproteobacteria bacterium]